MLVNNNTLGFQDLIFSTIFVTSTICRAHSPNLKKNLKRGIQYGNINQLNNDRIKC